MLKAYIVVNYPFSCVACPEIRVAKGPLSRSESFGLCFRFVLQSCRLPLRRASAAPL